MVKAHLRSGLTERQETAGSKLALQNHRPTCPAPRRESRAFIELGKVDIKPGFLEQRPLDGAEDVGRRPPARENGRGKTVAGERQDHKSGRLARGLGPSTIEQVGGTGARHERQGNEQSAGALPPRAQR